MQKSFTLSALMLVLASHGAQAAVAAVDLPLKAESVGTLYTKAESSYAITLIDDECIAQAKAGIAREFTRNGYMRLACKSVAAAAVLYTAYKVLEAQFAKPEVIKVRLRDLPAGARPDVYYYPPSREEFDALADRLKAFKDSIDPNWFTWQWLKNWGKNISKGLVSMAITKGVFDAGDRILEDVFHDGNIQWFFKTHTQTVETMNELNGYIQQLASCNGAGAEGEHCKKQIAAVTNSFLRQIGLLIAFIEYQRDQLPQGSAAYAEATNLSEYMRICANDLGDALQQILNANTVGKSKAVLEQAMNKFASEFARCVGSFERIEKELEAIA